jgi:hypothetical protein
MNALLELLSLVLGVGITIEIYKLCGILLPKFFTATNFKPTDER